MQTTPTKKKIKNSRVVFTCGEIKNTSETKSQNWPPPGRRKRHPAGNSRYYTRPFSEYFLDTQIFNSEEFLNRHQSFDEPRVIDQIRSSLGFISISEQDSSRANEVNIPQGIDVTNGITSSLATSGFYSGTTSPPCSPHSVFSSSAGSESLKMSGCSVTDCLHSNDSWNESSCRCEVVTSPQRFCNDGV